MTKEPMMLSRRTMITSAATALGSSGAIVGGGQAAQQGGPGPTAGRDGNGWEKVYPGGPESPGLEPRRAGAHYQPVVTPNGVTLPWKIVDGVKVGHLIAE